MPDFLGTDKDLQSIEVELVNNTSNLTKIYERIKQGSKKFREIEGDPT